MNSPVSFAALSLHARSLNIPDSAHPNKLPFSGVLTKIDVPSDSSPEGSNGRRILVTRAAAEKAIDSLLVMGVNYKPDGHSPQEKIGVIFGSEIIGKKFHIHRVIYAADFPEVAEQIQVNKEKLGFSFEARELFHFRPMRTLSTFRICLSPALQSFYEIRLLIKQLPFMQTRMLTKCHFSLDLAPQRGRNWPTKPAAQTNILRSTNAATWSTSSPWPWPCPAI